jgi:peptidoglycan/xylan/chitin deacetylase (PgdA/CDA1 family)
VAPIVTVPTSITLDVGSVRLTFLGETRTPGVTVRDQFGEPVSSALVWVSLDESVATVSEAGVVVAVGNGTTSVSVTAGEATASVDVDVGQVASSVVLSVASWSFDALADTLRMTAVVSDAGASEIVGAEIVWASLDTLVATVGADGLVTARSNGVSSITVVVGGLVETASITVDQKPGGMTLSADSVRFSSLGDTTTLTVSVTDAGGSQYVGAPVTWVSSATAVAEVSASGRVTGISNGVATITATSGLIVSTAAVTVSQSVASLVLDSGSVSLRDPGDQATMGLSVTDARGVAVTTAVVVWSSGDPGVALVDSLGMVTGVSTGSTPVVARSGVFADTVLVTVEPELTIVALGPATVTTQVLSEVSLSARVEDLLGAAQAGTTVSWGVGTVSGSIASEPITMSDGTGSVGAVWSLDTIAGTQRAFATIESRGQAITVEFLALGEAGPAVTADLIADTVLLSANGETVFLSPTYADSWGNTALATAIAWSSSDPLVASVASDGLVTGVAAGATWVRGAIGGPVDSILVTVAMRGAITITFDDGRLNAYQNGWPIMQSMGLPGNVAVNSGPVDSSFPSYMTEVMLNELHSAGWSMVSHTVNHDSLSTLTPVEVDYELRVNQQWLLDRGYNGSNVFVAPYHDYGPAERIAVSGYYTAARGQSASAVTPDSLVQWMPANPYLLTGLEADLMPYTTVAGRDLIRGVLQRTVDEGAFVDLFFHLIPPENAAAFQELMNIVAVFRDRVLPYHELYPISARPVF